MAINERLRFAGKVAGWGAESGIIVTLAGVLPVLFLGTYVIEDLAALALLIAYGLLFGHYLAGRLGALGLVPQGQSRALRIVPPIALCTGYLGMRLLIGVSEATTPSAIDGLVFGGLAGVVFGLVLQRLPVASSVRAPVPAVVTIPLICLGAGVVMGLIAGVALSFPLGWMFAIPIWQAGMGATTGFFLAPATQSS